MKANDDTLQTWLQTHSLPEADKLALAPLRCDGRLLYRQHKPVLQLNQVRAYRIERRAGSYMGLQDAAKHLSHDVLVLAVAIAAPWLLPKILPASALAWLQPVATTVVVIWFTAVLGLLLYSLLRARKHPRTAPSQPEHFRLYATTNPAQAPKFVAACQEQASLLLLQQYLQQHTSHTA